MITVYNAPYHPHVCYTEGRLTYKGYVLAIIHASGGVAMPRGVAADGAHNLTTSRSSIHDAVIDNAGCPTIASWDIIVYEKLVTARPPKPQGYGMSARGAGYSALLNDVLRKYTINTALHNAGTLQHISCTLAGFMDIFVDLPPRAEMGAVLDAKLLSALEALDQKLLLDATLFDGQVCERIIAALGWKLKPIV